MADEQSKWYSACTGRVLGWFEKPLNRAARIFAQLSDVDSPDDPLLLALVAGVRSILPAGEGDEDFRRVLERKHSHEEVNRVMELFARAEPIDPATAADVLGSLPEEKRTDIVRMFVSLAAARRDYEKVRETFIRPFALELPMTPEDFAVLENESLERLQRQRKLLKSGTGIVVALIVIAVFALMATWLKSVLFGLILAGTALPLERFFEKCVRNVPLRRPPAREGELTPAELEKRKERIIVGRASTLTVLSVVIGVLILLCVLTGAGSNYVSRVRQSFREEHVESRNAHGESNRKAKSGLTARLDRYFQDLRVKFESFPPVRAGLDEARNYLHSERAQRDLTVALLKKSGGALSLAAGIVGFVGKLLLDCLLTVFFFMLFLKQLALFRPANGQDKFSEYLVRTIFNGKWLPGATEESLEEGRRIIAAIIGKLGVWMRGYFTLVSIDLVVYTTAFYFLDVPYFFIFGPIAATGILLPYIGPISSALLTITATLVLGNDVTFYRIAAIAGTYAIYNGVIEQFILYPAVIGELLGLTTLETIIVVLLGGIFAGITGMIFAIPAAAAVKYLIPQIYKCWD